jgi:hypothetical protein
MENVEIKTLENIENVDNEEKVEEEITIGSKSYTHEKHGSYDRGSIKIFQKNAHFAPDGKKYCAFGGVNCKYLI